MFIVYSKETVSKVLFEVNLNQEDLNVVMGGNVFKDHPEYNEDNSFVVQQQYPYNYPTYDESTLTIREMTTYEKYQNGLYALSFNEKEYKGDIITLEPGQYINPEGELVTVPPIDGFRVEWNWETNEWEEKATNLEIVQAQYSEYEGMDTPSTIQEMKLQDEAMATEYLNMMIELRGLIYTLSAQEAQSIGYSAIHIPVPSKNLEAFKNKFKLTK